ncbi:MAG: hypothetical protein WA651_16820 [Candidatus Sulfotelmatobacter sp.]
MTNTQTIYPAPLRRLGRKYDALHRKLMTSWDDADYRRLGRIGDELAMRAAWGGR